MHKIASLRPMTLNGWNIQGSILDNDTILIILQNVDNDAVHMRYFTDETKAHQFLTDVVYGGSDVSKEGEF